MSDEYYEDATNWAAWAIGKWNKKRTRMKVRKVVWGRLLARAEKRDDEDYIKCAVMILAPECRRPRGI